jgi:predicted nucleotidyltransferase
MGAPTIALHPFLADKLPGIAQLCAQNRVQALYAFGSVVDGRFCSERSDIDLLIELLPMKKAEKAKTLAHVWFRLGMLLDRPVDMLTPACVRDPFFKKYLAMYKVEIYREPTLKKLK